MFPALAAEIAARGGGPTWLPSATSPARHDFGAVSVWPAEREASHGGGYGPAPPLAAAAYGPIQACRKCNDDSCVDETNCSHEHAPEPQIGSAPRPATSDSLGAPVDTEESKRQGTKRGRDEPDEGGSSRPATTVMSPAQPRQPRPPQAGRASSPLVPSTAPSVTTNSAASAPKPAERPMRARAVRRAEARARAAEAMALQHSGPSNALTVTPTLTASAPTPTATSTPVAPQRLVPRSSKLGGTPSPPTEDTRAKRARLSAPEDLAAASSASSGVEPRLRMVEVGAGTGRNSDYVRDLVLMHHANRDTTLRSQDVHYTATDVAGKGGPGGHMESVPPKSGIRAKEESVDANVLESHFARESLDTVVGVNPFGNWDKVGASYGVRTHPVPHARPHQMVFDPRLLNSAHQVLKEGGKLRLFGRTQILKRSNRTPNPFLNAPPGDLQQAANLGFDVHVRRAFQDKTRTFERPDTKHTDKNPNANLGPFNTQLVFRKRQGGGGVKLHTAEREKGSGGALAVDSDEDLAPSEMPSSHAAMPAAASHSYAPSSSLPHASSSRAPASAAASTRWGVNNNNNHQSHDDDDGYHYDDNATHTTSYGAGRTNRDNSRNYGYASTGGFGYQQNDHNSYAAAASSSAAYRAAQPAAAQHSQGMDEEDSPEEENERLQGRDEQDEDELDDAGY